MQLFCMKLLINIAVTLWIISNEFWQLIYTAYKIVVPWYLMNSLLFLHRDNQCWPDCSTSLQTTGLPGCHCQRYQSKGMFSVTNVFIFEKRISVEIFLAGCNTRPGGTDVQRSIHWQRRHVEIKKVFGRLFVLHSEF